MAVVLSRDLQDGESGGTGAGDRVGDAAIKLAQLTRCPNLSSGGGTGYRGMMGVEAMEDSRELIASSTRGFDFMFHSGIQHDKFGNMNLHFVGGDFHHPKFKGPGVPNVSYADAVQRFYIYPNSHTARNFVERVDFISIAGNIDGPDGRRKRGILTEGPRLVVTPLCVMDFDKSTGTMRLKSVHESITVEEVLKNTGFKPIMPAKVDITTPPTAEELRVLRQEIWAAPGR
ncbi:MAG: hypothetical protein EXR53_06230 [Dehalococcoidia bacterium]|nr:hypothetical protein [Dehalococcoidia bacterium]